MSISKTANAVWNRSNKKYYIDKGYVFTNFKDIFKAKIEDLTNSSTALVEVKCDNVDCENNNHIKDMTWRDYLRVIKNKDKYYCNSCVYKIYRSENTNKTKIKNGRSFEQWCVDNNRQDVLKRWDYELNNCNLSEVTYKSGKKYYFKCPEGIHKSELKIPNSYTSGREGSISCKACNSFAQWGIKNISKDFLEKYWDYEKNTFDPLMIDRGSNKSVWIKCQEKYYHDSYNITCNDFINNIRCPYCAKTKIHVLDSLGTLYTEVLDLWSIKNKTTPYEYSCGNHKEVWWKCSKGKHHDYKRNIADSRNYDFRCPECQYSKGEERISNVLIDNNWVKISQADYDNLIDKNNKNYYIPQKTFNNLRGVGNGLLSYDHYLLNINLLVEYQGNYHDGTVNNQTKEDFEIQQEHDRRKRKYCFENNIRLLEIWYWDFDRIEEILFKIINKVE